MIPRRRPVVLDLISLVKPRIMMMALLTTAGGVALAPGPVGAVSWLPVLLGTALLVGAANTLNMYLEREVDAKMARTRERPLPAHRLAPAVALWFGVAQSFAAVPLLTFAINPLTGLLGVIALLTYVLLYTPLKQRTTVAVWVGAVPGAMPPLLGWTAATGVLDAGGLTLFAVLFLWQIPHFHAIALFRTEDYRRAGLKILPVERGETATQVAIVAYLAVQIVVSLFLAPLGVAGTPYLVSAVVLGLLYLGYALIGLVRATGVRPWGRSVFLASILYLPLLFAALVLDGRQ